MRLGIALLCEFVYISFMDWKKLIEELIASGFNQTSISKEIGLTQPTICRILNGDQKDMKWMDGQRLLTLYTSHKNSTKSKEAA